MNIQQTPQTRRERGSFLNDQRGLLINKVLNGTRLQEGDICILFGDSSKSCCTFTVQITSISTYSFYEFLTNTAEPIINLTKKPIVSEAATEYSPIYEFLSKDGTKSVQIQFKKDKSYSIRLIESDPQEADMDQTERETLLMFNSDGTKRKIEDTKRIQSLEGDGLSRIIEATYLFEDGKTVLKGGMGDSFPPDNSLISI